MIKIEKGYEIVGIEKIPETGPAIFVLYHPEGPLDAAFFMSKIFLERNRKILAIVERMNFKMPGF